MLQIMAAANYLEIKDLLQFTARVIFHDVTLYQKARSSAECLDALRAQRRCRNFIDLEKLFDILGLHDVYALRGTLTWGGHLDPPRPCE